ncbi:MAG: hypothetical protein AAF577_14280 [Pseudomonadota bacterium]
MAVVDVETRVAVANGPYRVAVAFGGLGRAVAAMRAGYAASREIGVDDTPRGGMLKADAAAGLRERFFT